MSGNKQHHDATGYALQVGTTVRFEQEKWPAPLKIIEGTVIELRDAGMVQVEAFDGSMHVVAAKDVR